MGENFVDELQRLAMDTSTPISALLFRAKAVATKLGMNADREWIEHEISGYPAAKPIPPYRVVPSELRVQNPVHGWKPVRWSNGMSPLQEHFASSEIRFPIAQVEAQSQAKGSALHASLLPAEIDFLSELGNHAIDRLESARVFSRADFVGIIGAVRARVLDWALSISQEDRKKQDKFGILDSPKQYEADFTPSIGALGVSVIYFDLDDFKALNTRFTEPIIDRTLLPELQHLIAKLVRGRGMAYAEGGDEFVIILPNTNTALAETFAGVLLSQIRSMTFTIGSDTVRITASAGIASTMRATDVQTCRDAASGAKREAKQQGKDRVVVSSLRT